jgi:energy-coupling factor transport system substrate-specific component
MKAKKIAFLSILISLSVVGRIYFTFIPNVQPTTAIIIMTAMFLGVRNGMLVAVMSAVLSNLILGMGIWTIGQVVAWSLIGFTSGLLGKKKDKIPLFILAFYSGATGILYGFILSLFFYSISTGNFIAYYLAGIPFDMAHAIGNIVFFLVLYPVLSKILKRFKINRLSSARE